MPESTAGVFQRLWKIAIYEFCHEKGYPGRPGSVSSSPGKAPGSTGDCYKLGECFFAYFHLLSWDSWIVYFLQDEKKTKKELPASSNNCGFGKVEENCQ